MLDYVERKLGRDYIILPSKNVITKSTNPSKGNT